MFQPHRDADLTTIGLDAPDNRRWELDAEEARTLVAVLERAAVELQRVQKQIAAGEARRTSDRRDGA